LRDHIRREFPAARRIGVLASGEVRERGLFEAYFRAPDFEVLHPRAEHDADAIVQAGCASESDALLCAAYADLAAQRADVIVPGLTEIASMLERTGPREIPHVDCNLAYAQYAASDCYAIAADANGHDGRQGPIKIGVVGGVGPAATVDFLGKIVRNTQAKRDQDHVKVLLEQNPQIPDRTGHLVGSGPDPTIALYATCKKLEAGHADLIAIPCNTAHAFVERIQRYLGIPIVNMLTETVQHIRVTFPELKEVGVLATSGTVASGVYRDALEAHGLRQIVPGAPAQERVMRAIYGERGVKAGYTSGQCVDDILEAVEELVAHGVGVMILGCTELPILLDSPQLRTASGKTVALVDPTDVLAKRCVEYALAGGTAAASR
jgi:aspartate racemase